LWSDVAIVAWEWCVSVYGMSVFAYDKEYDAWFRNTTSVSMVVGCGDILVVVWFVIHWVFVGVWSDVVVGDSGDMIVGDSIAGGGCECVGIVVGWIGSIWSDSEPFLWVALYVTVGVDSVGVVAFVAVACDK
jgi:hypothetical protein